LKEASPPDQKKMPRMSRALFEFGGPGRNRPELKISNPAKAYMASSWISQNLSFDRKPGLWYFQYQLIR
jgi:hypothetical protein